MEWIYENDRPIYIQLVEQISRAILIGKYLPGSKLPGVRELATEAAVNPNTMQRALTELENLGLVFSKRTVGRFVTEDTEKISKQREQIAIELTRQYLCKMRAVGCEMYDIERYINQTGKNMEGDTL